MRLYWSVKSIPELADLSDVDRERLWRRGYVHSLRSRRTKIALTVGIALALAGLASGLAWATGLGALAGAILLFQVTVAEARPFWHEERNRLQGSASDPSRPLEEPGEPAEEKPGPG